MHKGKTVYKYGHIIPGVIVSALLDILVYDLDEVVVDVVLVEQFDVLAFSCVSFENLDIVILYLLCLGYNIIIFVGYALTEEPLPFTVCEVVGVELFQLRAQVPDEVGLRVDREILIPLLPKESDELLFQISLTLVVFRRSSYVVIFCDHSVFLTFRDDIVLCHYYASCLLLCSFPLEDQKFISVILVLLSSLFHLRRKSGGKVVCQAVETVKDARNPLLFCH